MAKLPQVEPMRNSRIRKEISLLCTPPNGAKSVLGGIEDRLTNSLSVLDFFEITSEVSSRGRFLTDSVPASSPERLRVLFAARNHPVLSKLVGSLVLMNH